MRAILEFDLSSDNGDREDYEIYVQAPKMASALWDMSQYLRELYKYGEYSEEVSKKIEEIRERFFDICSELKEDTI